MTALSADKNTLKRASGDRFSDPVKAATTIHSGALVCLDASGNAQPRGTLPRAACLLTLWPQRCSVAPQ